MKEGTSPDWRELCKQAAVERDSQKLLELIGQIEQALEERERWLLQQCRAKN